MSATLARHTGSRCPMCHDQICKGDLIVVVDDRWLHEECEPNLTPWTEAPTGPAPVTHKLVQIVGAHGTLGKRLLEMDFSPEEICALPQAIQEALFFAVSAENELYSLLNDLAAEHVRDDA